VEEPAITGQYLQAPGYYHVSTAVKNWVWFYCR